MDTQKKSINDLKTFTYLLDQESDEKELNNIDTSKIDNLKNPFFDVYLWIKGEISDIESINHALAIRD
jgi:hypothetical protein